MPIYEYVCKECDQKFEVLVQGREEVTCPSCKSLNITKQYSTFAPATRQSSTPPPAPTCSPGGCGSCAFRED